MAVGRGGLAGLALLGAIVACADRTTPDAGQPAASQEVPAPGPAKDWERTDYSASLLTAADLRALSLEDLQHVRAIIFGRHGRVFQDSALQGWLAARPWYRADTGFTNKRLSAREAANLDRVRESEAAKHAHIEPGDMRFYQNRLITSAMLGTHSPQDWEVLKAEVLANHGYVFYEDDEEEDGEEPGAMSWRALQQYFDERYWYARVPEFGSGKLSAIERQNIDTIIVALTRQLGRTVSPGMMHLFARTPLTEENLRGISIADLRILRNEVYARHGREFKSDWVRRQFRFQAWYTPRPDFVESELSDVERANIALITRREAALHEQLGTRLLTVEELMGLPPDEARRLRNEIYARHGRRFRDAGLQRYFASFPWYRANDAFQESQLNDTERKNADLISQYESGKFTEG